MARTVKLNQTAVVITTVRTVDDSGVSVVTTSERIPHALPHLRRRRHQFAHKLGVQYVKDHSARNVADRGRNVSVMVAVTDTSHDTGTSQFWRTMAQMDGFTGTYGRIIGGVVCPAL